jgi:hypothetical protein
MVERNPANLDLTRDLEARCRLVVVEYSTACLDVGFDLHGGFFLLFLVLRADYAKMF